EAVLRIEADVSRCRSVTCRSSLREIAGDVRLETDIRSGRNTLKTFQCSCQGNALEVVYARQRRPETVLVSDLTPQTAMEIDAPGLTFTRAEFEGLERNRNFRDPTVFDDVCFDVPDAVPVRVHLAAFVNHLRVELGAGRIGGEDVTVAL